MESENSDEKRTSDNLLSIEEKISLFSLDSFCLWKAGGVQKQAKESINMFDLLFYVKDSPKMGSFCYLPKQQTMFSKTVQQTLQSKERGISLEITASTLFESNPRYGDQKDNLKLHFFYLITSLLPHRSMSDKFCLKEHPIGVAQTEAKFLPNLLWAIQRLSLTKSGKVNIL